MTNSVCIDAVRRGEGRRIDGKRIIVDRELGRTKASWFPRRLGGGKGEARRDRRDEETIRELKKQIEREREAQKRDELDKREKEDDLDEEKKGGVVKETTEAAHQEIPVTAKDDSQKLIDTGTANLNEDDIKPYDAIEFGSSHDDHRYK